MTVVVYRVPGDAGVDGFAASLAEQPNMVTGEYTSIRFANGNQVVEVAPEVQREVDARVVVLAPTLQVGESLVEFGLLVDALARTSSRPIVAVLQYVPYSRSCRLTAPGQALGAATYLRMLESAPVDHIVTFDLHARELVGFFTKPVTSLRSLPLLAKCIDQHPERVVIGPDRGRYDDCLDLADTLRCSFDLLLKVRDGHEDRSRLLGGVDSVLAGRPVVLFDDEITRGLTAMHALESIVEAGADDIVFMTPYDFASAQVRTKVMGVPGVRRVVTTNLGRPAPPHPPHYEVIDVAGFAAIELNALLAGAVRV
jgi:ribose-phosphate pyrophosphokinase